MLWEILGLIFFAMQVVMLVIALIGLTLAILGFSEEGLQRVLYRILR